MYCNYTVISDVGVNITIHVTEDGSQNQTEIQPILCIEHEPKNVTFSDLRRNTAYVSFVSWTFSENPMKCMLSATEFITGKINLPVNENVLTAYFTSCMQRNQVLTSILQ